MVFLCVWSWGAKERSSPLHAWRGEETQNVAAGPIQPGDCTLRAFHHTRKADYSALRAAYGGCALYAPAGAVVRNDMLNL